MIAAPASHHSDAGNGCAMAETPMRGPVLHLADTFWGTHFSLSWGKGRRKHRSGSSPFSAMPHVLSWWVMGGEKGSAGGTDDILIVSVLFSSSLSSGVLQRQTTLLSSWWGPCCTGMWATSSHSRGKSW